METVTVPLVRSAPSAIAAVSLGMAFLNPLLGLALAVAAVITAALVGRHPGRLALMQTVLITLALVANLAWFVLALPAAAP